MDDLTRYDWERSAVITRNQEDGPLSLFHMIKRSTPRKKKVTFKANLNGNANSLVHGLNNCPLDFMSRL
jgi:hypothetical protein